jgi:hypothetical protein
MQGGLRSVVEEWCRQAIDGEILRSRPDNDRVVVRLIDAAGMSIIAKLWMRNGLCGCVRRLTRTSSAYAEWRTLNRLLSYGIKVPRALDCWSLSMPGCSYTDVVVLEDLGECRTAFDILQHHIAAGMTLQREALDKEVVELTRAILEAGIVDPDHSMVNLVYPRSRPGLYRVDGELGRRWVGNAKWELLCGRMLGRLVTGYTFAVQPHTYLAEGFAARLADELSMSPRVLREARLFISKRLEKQRMGVGIDTRLKLDW